MAKYQPYRLWTREELENHLVKQCKEFNAPEYAEAIIQAVNSDKWDPTTDFDGCTVVQDKLHPYAPCFLHDFNWIVKKGGIVYDIQFRKDLIKFGMHPIKAFIMFLGVRLGWLLYYKWVNLKGSVKTKC